MLGAFQDVTARKLIEEDLAASRELLQVTLESIGDAVITTDVDGIVQWLNPVAEYLTGWSKVDSTGRPLADVFVIIDEGTRTTATDPVLQALREGRVVGLREGTILIARDGTEYGVEDSASPIRDRTGRSLGAVLVFHDVSAQRRLAKEMSHRASHDVLTGLPNRDEFESRLQRVLDRLQHAPSENELLMLDLDQFKLVNDACGHAVGDVLLQQVSALFRACIRARDTVARLGGDEFGILLEQCDAAHASRVAQTICDRMREFRFVHDGRRFGVGASIGLVPLDARWVSMPVLLQAADGCCYAAKEAGRNRVYEWVETDTALMFHRSEMHWVSRLEHALDDDGFLLYAQRIYPLRAVDTAIHCEILLRDARSGRRHHRRRSLHPRGRTLPHGHTDRSLGPRSRAVLAAGTA